MSVSTAGRYRFLRVHVKARGAEGDVAGSIGHELRHAIEVLDNRTVTTTAGLRYFYLHGVPGGSTGGFLSPFETAAAVEAGDAARLEMQEYRRGPQPLGAAEAIIEVSLEDSGCVASSRVLEAAKAEASRTYANIGVSLAWTHRATKPTPWPWPAGAPDVTVVLLSRARTDTFLMHRRLSHTALGVAPSGTRRVYLFCERIRQRAVEMAEKGETILGRVIAHEIGHHLLPAKGHSAVGIMRESLDYKTEEPLRFTEVEANLIRALLPASK